MKGSNLSLVSDIILRAAGQNKWRPGEAIDSEALRLQSTEAHSIICPANTLMQFAPLNADPAVPFVRPFSQTTVQLRNAGSLNGGSTSNLVIPSGTVMRMRRQYGLMRRVSFSRYVR